MYHPALHFEHLHKPASSSLKVSQLVSEQDTHVVLSADGKNEVLQVAHKV